MHVKWICSWVAGLLLLGAMACGGNDQTSAEADARLRELNNRLALQINTMQQHIYQLDKQIVEMRAQQDQRINEMTAASQALTSQLQQMRAVLTPGAVAEAPQLLVTPPGPAPEAVLDEGASPWLSLTRLLIVIVLLVAIFIIVKIFMSRAQETDDEDEELDEPLRDETVSNELGTIRLSPEVQREMSRPAETEKPAENDRPAASDKPADEPRGEI